jgi:hypothetical protein
LIQAFNPHWINLDDAQQNKPFAVYSKVIGHPKLPSLPVSKQWTSFVIANDREAICRSKVSRLLYFGRLLQVACAQSLLNLRNDGPEGNQRTSFGSPSQ